MDNNHLVFGLANNRCIYPLQEVDIWANKFRIVMIDAGNGNVLYKSEGKPISSFAHLGHPGKLMSGPFGHPGPFGLWDNRIG